MRVLSLTAFGLENLRVEERPEPEPKRGEVLLRLRSASLNYRDYLMVTGKYNPRQKLPLVPASDAVGEVVAIGPEVTRVAVGDRACPVFAQRWFGGLPTRDVMKTSLGGPLDGVLAEYMVTSAESVVRIPAYLSNAEAACLPCAGVTAFSALVTQGGLLPGQIVLTQGTGGVSLFAVQIARLMGAKVFITSRDDQKLERAAQLGAHELINSVREPEWAKRARVHAPDGVDHVIELGGASTLEQSLRAVRPGGIVSIIGMLGGNIAPLNVIPVLMQNLRLQGVYVGNRDTFEALVRAFEAEEVHPVVDRIFEMADARAAFEYLASGKHFGKVCVQLDE
jgi:NADPH:quinone reductase-like Zn-dependent oxidoreductase